MQSFFTTHHLQPKIAAWGFSTWFSTILVLLPSKPSLKQVFGDACILYSNPQLNQGSGDAIYCQIQINGVTYHFHKFQSAPKPNNQAKKPPTKKSSEQQEMKTCKGSTGFSKILYINKCNLLQPSLKIEWPVFKGTLTFISSLSVTTQTHHHNIIKYILHISHCILSFQQNHAHMCFLYLISVCDSHPYINYIDVWLVHCVVHSLRQQPSSPRLKLFFQQLL